MTQESGIVQGVIYQGPNRWSLIFDGLVRGLPLEFSIGYINAGNLGEKVVIPLRVKLIENEGPADEDNNSWNLSGWIEFGHDQKLRKKICQQTGIEYKSETEEPFLYFFCSYSSEGRKGMISFTYDYVIAKRRKCS